MTHHAPLITVLTPTYNHDQYLGQCLDSVIAQTELRWEQIVVDDGSDDGTPEVALGYSDPRIRYVRQENAGIYRLAETLNRALATARGEFIAVVSGDDFWPPDKLAVQLSAFDDRDVVLSWGSAAVVDADGNFTTLVPPTGVIQREQGRSRGETFKSLLAGNHIPACTVMCRRDALAAIGGFQQPPNIPVEDYPTWLEMAKSGRFAPLNEVLGYRRSHPTQVTATMEHEVLNIAGWTEVFVGGMAASECAELGVAPSDLRRIVARSLAAARFTQGRLALRRGGRPEAKRLFLGALPHGSLKTRAQATVAFVCAVVDVDFDDVYEGVERFRRLVTRVFSLPRSKSSPGG